MWRSEWTAVAVYMQALTCVAIINWLINSFIRPSGRDVCLLLTVAGTHVIIGLITAAMGKQ